MTQANTELNYTTFSPELVQKNLLHVQSPPKLLRYNLFLSLIGFPLKNPNNEIREQIRSVVFNDGMRHTIHLRSFTYLPSGSMVRNILAWLNYLSYDIKSKKYNKIITIFGSKTSIAQQIIGSANKCSSIQLKKFIEQFNLLSDTFFKYTYQFKKENSNETFTSSENHFIFDRLETSDVKNFWDESFKDGYLKICLSDFYIEMLAKHSFPVDAHIFSSFNCPRKMDFYNFLHYQNTSLCDSSSLTELTWDWDKLYDSYGGGIATPRKFKQTLSKVLSSILVEHPFYATLDVIKPSGVKINGLLLLPNPELSYHKLSSLTHATKLLTPKEKLLQVLAEKLCSTKLNLISLINLKLQVKELKLLDNYLNDSGINYVVAAYEYAQKGVKTSLTGLFLQTLANNWHNDKLVDSEWNKEREIDVYDICRSKLNDLHTKSVESNCKTSKQKLDEIKSNLISDIRQIPKEQLYTYLHNNVKCQDFNSMISVLVLKDLDPLEQYIQTSQTYKLIHYMLVYYYAIKYYNCKARKDYREDESIKEIRLFTNNCLVGV